MNQPVPRWLACPQCLFQRIQNKLGVHAAADPPTHDVTREHVHHEGHMDKALPGRDTGKVRDPGLVRPPGHELPVDMILRARCGLIGTEGPYRLAARHPMQPNCRRSTVQRATRCPSRLS